MYTVLLFVVIITGREVLFKDMDFTKDDEHVLLTNGKLLFETGKATMFTSLLAVTNALMLLFFLPSSFIENDPVLNSIPAGLHVILFLFVFVIPYVFHQYRGEKLERIFRELIYLNFKEKTEKLNLEELPSFLFEFDTSEKQKEPVPLVEGSIRPQLAERRDNDPVSPKKDDRIDYDELIVERTDFFKKYFPLISDLFTSPTAALNAYYFSEMLKRQLQNDPELVHIFIARNSDVNS
jgi:hypothetical protein